MVGLVGVVGPCAAGKSTLVRGLRARGYTAREIRQEHSVAPTMWQKIARPALLIYLDVEPLVAAHREGLAAPPPWWADERDFRLAHARAHCDLYVDTTTLTPEEILARVVGFLESGQREA